MIKKIIAKTKHHAKYWKGEILFMVELIKHPDVPRLAKILVFTLLSYIFSPIDIIPDFIPIFGHWDDLLMIPIIMKIIMKITPKDTVEAVRQAILDRGDVALFEGAGPKIAAFTVLVLWVFISWLFLKLLGYGGHLPFT